MHAIIFSSTLVTVKEKNKKNYFKLSYDVWWKVYNTNNTFKNYYLGIKFNFYLYNKIYENFLYLMKYKILFLLEAWYWFINYFISNHIT